MIQRLINITLILALLVLFSNCKRSSLSEEKNLFKDALIEPDTFDSTFTKQNELIVEGFNLNDHTKRFEIDGYQLTLVLPSSFSIDDSSNNYYSFSTEAAFGASFDVHGHALTTMDNVTNSTRQSLLVTTEIMKGWTYDRKGIIRIDGLEFGLVMGSQKSTDDHFNYEFNLFRVAEEKEIEFRFTDNSTRYNYSPEEALEQMRAMASKILNSIRVSKN